MKHQLIQYKTIDQPFSHEIPKIKGSRFIGYLYPVNSTDEALARIQSHQQQHHHATHSCWAYRCNPRLHYDLFGQPHIDATHHRHNDDGEPAGSAGKPIYNAIQAANLHNCLCIVTRYYGGTKLGIGGLIQAYGEASKQAIHHASSIIKGMDDTIAITFSYEMTAKAMYYIEKYQASIQQQTYDKDSTILVYINKGLTDSFVRECRDSGKIAVNAL